MKKSNIKKTIGLLILSVGLLSGATLTHARVITVKKSDKLVDHKTMQQIYEEIKTPYKYGVVLKGEDGHKLDSPSVFRYQRSTAPEVVT